jgi:hypothetical protein
MTEEERDRLIEQVRELYSVSVDQIFQARRITEDLETVLRFLERDKSKTLCD